MKIVNSYLLFPSTQFESIHLERAVTPENGGAL